MHCVSLVFFEQLIVYVIFIVALIAIIQLLIPWLATATMPIVGQILRIVLWAVVAIVVVYLIFTLLGCMIGGPPFSALLTTFKNLRLRRLFVGVVKSMWWFMRDEVLLAVLIVIALLGVAIHSYQHHLATHKFPPPLPPCAKCENIGKVRL